MQPPFLSQLSVQCDTVTQLLPPIEFDCIVEGKKLKAKITHQEDNGLQFIYHISFSDGYAASFVAAIEGGNWHSRDFASPYARAIQDDLHAFCGFVPSRPPFAIRLKSEQEVFNVWVVPHVAMTSHYAVFYKGDYHFDLRKTKQWEAKSVREYSPINQEIASLVCKNIERRTLQPQLF